MAEKSVRVIVSGRVQGVFFRAGALQMARSFGLNGWVRNLYDGTVEALFQGDEQLVNKAIRWCDRGPPCAMVTDIEIHDEVLDDNLKNFYIKY